MLSWFVHIRVVVLAVMVIVTGSLTPSVRGDDPFRQLDDLWPTPSEIRRPSGAPGDEYWQQRVDYQIAVRIDEPNRRLIGAETITYHNHSPDDLRYLWLQLDQNRFAPHSDENLSATAPDLDDLSYKGLRGHLYRRDFAGGYEINGVTQPNGAELEHQIIGTMMRVTLPVPLTTGQSFSFVVQWSYKIIDAKAIRVRGGFEHFEDDDNDLFAIAQWYPRLCAYTDYGGWQTKQTTGQEFTLEFGDFDVSITVPDDHIVAATGELQNPAAVLTDAQRQRLEEAQSADAPVMIVTLEEATANESSKPEGEKTWRFAAENVRDFSFAASRKFLWDAQAFDLNGRSVLAMSFWPKEGEPLWSKLSTAAVIHAVKSYSKFTFDYPYPVIISVNAPIPGMEYPMITFQSARPEEDGSYPESTKYRLISVIIHEVGHSWFPMVVNSDERQWRWMDEGLNSFVQMLAEQEWEDEYPSRLIAKDRRDSLIRYMRAGYERPIMSAPEVLRNGTHTAYSKPTLALSILRETVLGRETFDFAFQQYSRRWMFKRPTPSDFFRSMEDAAGRDLDWFWRTWFYSTDHVDLSVKDLVHYRLDTRDPSIEKPIDRKEHADRVVPLIARRNRDIPKRVDIEPAVDEFYSTFDEFAVRPDEERDFQKLLEKLDPKEKAMLKVNSHFYMVTIANEGGVISPVPLKVTFDDGSTDMVRMPAEIWRYHADEVRRLLVTDREVVRVEIDPDEELADADHDDNRFPRSIRTETFTLDKTDKKKNVMQKIQQSSDEVDATSSNTN